METTIKVEGMMCCHCEKHVKDAVEKIDGIISATPSHESGTVTIVSNQEIDVAVIKEAIENEGYKVNE